MQFSAFVSMFRDFINRKNVSDEQAKIMINMAKLKLQRDFDLNFVLVKLAAQTYTVGGFSLPANFKKFAYQQSVVLTDSSTGRIVPLNGTTFNTVLRRANALGLNTVQGQSLPVVPSTRLERTEYYLQMFIADGAVPKLFLTPESVVTFDLYYNAWLVDYANDSEEDFLLTFGRDALLYASLRVNNTFAKEEEKIPIDEAAERAAMDKISEYCSSVNRSGSFIDAE